MHQVRYLCVLDPFGLFQIGDSNSINYRMNSSRCSSHFLFMFPLILIEMHSNELFFTK